MSSRPIPKVWSFDVGTSSSLENMNVDSNQELSHPVVSNQKPCRVSSQVLESSGDVNATRG